MKLFGLTPWRSHREYASQTTLGGEGALAQADRAGNQATGIGQGVDSGDHLTVHPGGFAGPPGDLQDLRAPHQPALGVPEARDG